MVSFDFGWSFLKNLQVLDPLSSQLECTLSKETLIKINQEICYWKTHFLNCSPSLAYTCCHFSSSITIPRLYSYTVFHYDHWVDWENLCLWVCILFAQSFLGSCCKPQGICQVRFIFFSISSCHYSPCFQGLPQSGSCVSLHWGYTRGHFLILLFLRWFFTCFLIV